MYAVTSPLAATLSHLHLSHVFTQYLYDIYFNILYSMPRAARIIFSIRFPTKTECEFLISPLIALYLVITVIGKV